jgi:hypothetical protein
MSEAMIAIKKVETGDTVVMSSDWDGASVFDWGDGNNSCDCNRSLHFLRTMGMSNEDAWLHRDVCGDSAYRVQVRNLQGDILYDEWAETQANTDT